MSNFNNPYPYNIYNPYGPQYTTNGVYQPTQTAGITTPNVEEHSKTVHGIDGANAYPLAPNSDILLRDADQKGIIYWKVTDSGGFATVETYKMQGPINTNKKEESKLDEILRRLDRLEKGANNVNS